MKMGILVASLTGWLLNMFKQTTQLSLIQIEFSQKCLKNVLALLCSDGPSKLSPNLFKMSSKSLAQVA